MKARIAALLLSTALPAGAWAQTFKGAPAEIIVPAGGVAGAVALPALPGPGPLAPANLSLAALRPVSPILALPPSRVLGIGAAVPGDRDGGSGRETSLSRLKSAAAAAPVAGGGEALSAEAGKAFEQGAPVNGAAEDPATELRRLREENAELRSQLAAKDRFMKTAVHDLNNPLTVMDGNLQLLLMRPLSDQQRKDAEAARTATQRIAGLVKSILDFARSGSTETPLRRAPVSLSALVRETAEGLSAQASGRGIRIELDLPDEAVVRGDADLLRRLVENLVSNAVKYNKDGGRLKVSVKPAAGGKILAFSDEGVGISEANLPKLFGPFFRADDVRHIQGNGLGLSSVKAIAERHGGKVEVESVLGRGTTFRVFLPD